MRTRENSLWLEGFARVGGVDEAGRGPLAGPVVAACVVLPVEVPAALDGLTDSKQLTAERREAYFEALRTYALAIGVGEASPAEIDEINILQATFLAMRRAIAAIDAPDFVLVDGNRRIRDLDLPQETIVKGDGKVLCIAAASVVAKVTRDRQLIALDVAFPGYGFARHKGYGTAAHYAALRALGPTAQHRQSFLRSFNASSPVL